jgi:shikimate kinase/3-dehydroquinate synthase
VVALDVAPETALARLRAQHDREGAAVARPMIAGDDPLSRIAALKATRLEFYDRADLTLPVDHADPDLIAAELARIARGNHDPGEPALRLRTPSASSAIHIAAGISRQLGAIVAKTWPSARRAWIVSDTTVANLHGEAVIANLLANGIRAELRAVPVGESSKSWATAGTLLDWLLDGGIERGDVLIALGGGVIGDLAGYGAASVLRGGPFEQVPTSLLAMVDSSIGGKTGINHRAGKNLIGAFYQPPVVVIDPAYLATLPHRELTAGWAEIIKHAIIQPSTPGGERADLFAFLERNGPALRALREPAISYAITRNVALKSAVVEADEKESGIRAYLNFGHTLGHAIEAADYRLLHGEAIAVGMRAAMRIGLRLGMVDSAHVQRIDDLLDTFDLPRTTSSDRMAILAKLGSDKKRVAGRQRWVLPLTGGGVELHSGVPEEVILDALRQVSG